MKMKDNINLNSRSQKLEPPDGGWGWFVVFGNWFNNIFNLSFMIVFGMVYGDVIKEMGEGTKGSSLVMNVSLLTANCFGPISGMLIKTTSYRTVAVIGSFIASSSIIASAYSTALWHLILIYGIIRGIGMCMIMTSAFVSMNSYFTTNKGKAIGFSAIGAGIGQAIMPYIVRFLMDEFSFKGTAIIMGALSFNGIAGALLMQPVEWHMKKKVSDSDEEQKFLTEKYSINLEKLPNENEKNTIKQSSMELSKSDDNQVVREPSRFISIWKRFLSSLDLDLLKDWRFVIIIFGNALEYISIVNFVILTPFLMQDLLKLNGQQSTLVLSVLSGADVVGRFLVPLITDKLRIKATHSVVLSCFVLVTVRQIMTFEIGLPLVIILSIFHGLGKTMFMLFQNISLTEYCRPDQVPSAVGLAMLLKGVLILPVGYFAGWVRDYSGDFIITIAVLNGMIVVAAILHITSIITSYFLSKSIDKSKVMNNL